MACAGDTDPATCQKAPPALPASGTQRDAQGYLASAWTDITDFAPANLIGAIPRIYVAEWQAAVQGKGFLFKIPYTITLGIVGGKIDHEAGIIRYYATQLNGQTAMFCESTIILRSISLNQMVFDERLRRMGADGRCPSADKVTFRPRDGQMLVEWFRAGSDKVRMSGWAQRQN